MTKSGKTIKLQS